MPTARALGGPLPKQAMALLALPTHYTSGLSPDASKLLKLLFLLLHIVLAISSNIPRIAGGPLIALGWLSRALGASNMVAGLARGCCGRNKEGFALVAGAPDSLCCCLVCKLVAVPGSDGQDLLFLGLLSERFLVPLTGRLFLRVSWTLFAALVLTLHTDFVMTVESAAFVTASMNAHTDGLLYPWY